MIRSDALQGHLLMILSTVLVATSFPVGAAIAGGMDPVVLTFLRFCLAALLFAPIVAQRFKHGPKEPHQARAEHAIAQSIPP